MAEIQYPYAYDENNDLVCIEDVQRETRYDHRYVCPCCGKGLVPRIGFHNAHHFAHDKGLKCGEESYIHFMAKIILEKRFYEGTLEVMMHRNFECKNQCEHFNVNTCAGKIDKTYNLSSMYDTVVVEKDIIEDGNIFRPDVTVSHSKGKYAPILFEICNTSPCSSKKMENCKNIIEIKVREFQDLIVLDTEPIEESVEVLGKRNDRRVACFNFKNLRLKPGDFPPDEFALGKSHCPRCLWPQESVEAPEILSPVIDERDKENHCLEYKDCYRNNSGPLILKMIWEDRRYPLMLPIPRDKIQSHGGLSLFELTVEVPDEAPLNDYIYDYLMVKSQELFPELRGCVGCPNAGRYRGPVPVILDVWENDKW